MTSQTTRLGMDEAMLTGKPHEAVANLAKQEKKLPQRDRLIFNLKKGQLLGFQNDYAGSNQAFFGARQLVEQLDQQAEISVTGSVGEVLATPNLMAYRPRIADRMYLHYYPALNFLKMGDLDGFRVEMRAAQDAHARIANRFRKQIAKERELLQKGRADAERQQQQMLAQQQTASSSTIDQNDYENTLLGDERMQNLYRNLQPFDPANLPEAKFQSGMIHFMEGLTYALTFSAANGDDYQRARKALQFAAQCSPENPVIQETRALLAEHRHQLTDQNKIWVIQENGLGPVIEEFRVALAFKVPNERLEQQRMSIQAMNPDHVIRMPVNNPLFSKAIFSFPVMKERDPNLFYSGLTVQAMGATQHTVPLSSPQEHQYIDFTGKLAVEQSSALIGGIVKAILSETIEKESEGNPLTSLLTGFASGALTHADTRVWNTLPREFRAATLDRPDNGRLRLSAPEGYLSSTPFDIMLPESGSSIVYVSTPGKYAPPKVTVINFRRESGQPVVQSFPVLPPTGPEADKTASLN